MYLVDKCGICKNMIKLNGFVHMGHVCIGHVHVDHVSLLNLIKSQENDQNSSGYQWNTIYSI